MCFEPFAATRESERSVRFALTPTLSPGERGNFSGVEEKLMGVGTPEPFGHDVG